MRIRLMIAATVLALVGLAGGAYAAMEQNTDRAGSDYSNVTLPSGSGPAQCESLCNADPGHCKAWTFVKPGVQDVNPRCWLKNAVPPKTSNNCCVSGVRVPPIESNTDRPGGDYANVTLPGGSNPQSCSALCDADGTCKAWTFVKAGVQAANPRCWLKNGVPAPRSADCCTSGVKQELH